MKRISQMTLPDGQIVRLAARVAEVDNVEAFRKCRRQLLDVLAQRVGEETLRRRQASQLTLAGSHDLYKNK